MWNKTGLLDWHVAHRTTCHPYGFNRVGDHSLLGGGSTKVDILATTAPLLPTKNVILLLYYIKAV